VNPDGSSDAGYITVWMSTLLENLFFGMQSCSAGFAFKAYPAAIVL
jgi:hypothetical protein